MTACVYTLHALAWTAFGVVLGVVLDRIVLDLRRVACAMKEATPVEPVDPAQETRRRRRRLGTAVVPAVLIAMAVVTAVQGVVNSRTNAAQDAEVLRVQQCQLAYANGFADAIEVRGEASAAWQNALDAWMTTLDELLSKTPPGSDPAAARERFKSATAEFLSKRAESKQQQAENPFPPAPRDLCK